MIMILCGACAAEQKSKPKTVRGSAKDTCMLCGRRRYCATYDIKTTEEEKK